MNSNGVLLLMIIIIAAMGISFNLALRCDESFIKEYGKRVLSYSWAGVCGFFDVAAISSFGGENKSRFIVLIIAAVLTYISVKSCKKRAVEMGADEGMVKGAMVAQFLAPLGIIGIYFAFAIGKSSNKKR